MQTVGIGNANSSPVQGIHEPGSDPSRTDSHAASRAVRKSSRMSRRASRRKGGGLFGLLDVTFQNRVVFTKCSTGPPTAILGHPGISRDARKLLKPRTS